MTGLDDHELLAEFARSESEAAFAELAGRHVNLVYSAALRFTGNPHHAQEITQAVFIILTRKAKGFSRKMILSGWLYQTARLTAANFVKGEIRRQQREQEAYMQSILTEPDAAAWQQIAPLLDEAMGRLGATDRNAVVLRFFENKTASEAGAALKLSEAATHKRTERALEKLRKFFTKRGVTFSAAVIAGAVSANSVHAAPVGLTATISATAAKGAAVAATVSTLVKGTLKIMAYAKIKLAIGVTAGILLAGSAATVVVLTGGRAGNKLSATVALLGGSAPDDGVSAGEVFQKAQAAYAALTSYSDEGKTISTLNGTTITHTFSIKLARPSLYRIEWEQSSESSGYTSTATKSAVWSAGDGNYLDMGFGEARKESSRESALSSATGISGGAAAVLPGTFFKINWGNQLGASTTNKKRLADEKVGEVDCFVFTGGSKDWVNTIWIGKQDFLIHQVRTVTSAAGMKAMMDKNLKSHPEIAARTPKTEYTDNISTETHENIVVNPKLAAADFAR